MENRNFKSLPFPMYWHDCANQFAAMIHQTSCVTKLLEDSTDTTR